jgi:hypothetical protein
MLRSKILAVRDRQRGEGKEDCDERGQQARRNIHTVAIDTNRFAISLRVLVWNMQKRDRRCQLLRPR